MPNLATWFSRHGWALPVSRRAADYEPGDIVTWALPGGLKHIGIVSDTPGAGGVRTIIHNIGSGAKEEDRLFAWTITGHYRVPAVKSVTGK